MKKTLSFVLSILLFLSCLFGCGKKAEEVDGTAHLEYNDVGSAYWVYRGACTEPNVIIPSNYKKDPVTMIGHSAFSYSSTLESVIIPDSVIKISSDAFRGCYNLKSITIPDSVTAIDFRAFDSCYSLTNIVIPESVTKIEANAFDNCDSLTIYCRAIDQPEGWNEKWNSSDCPVVWGYTGE